VNRERALLRHVGWPLHRLLLRVSGNRVGLRRAGDAGLGMLTLTTVGRRTREPRSVQLYFVEHGSDLVVVASNAGDANDPAWWLNLQATPQAEARTPAGALRVRGREATADERQRLWPELVRRYARYDHYAGRAGRQVPVVILEPLE